MVENVTLINTVTNAVLELSQDKYKTPFYVLEEVDWGQVQGTVYTYKYLNQVGESKQNVELGPRDVYVIGWVIGINEEDISNKKDFINMFVNPQQDLELDYDIYKLIFTPTTSVKWGIVLQENNRCMCKFKIDGTAYNPVFTEKRENYKEIATTKGMFHFPLIINDNPQSPPQILFGLRVQSLITTIINKGQTPTGFRLVFVSKGIVVNPILYNINNQLEFLKINKTLQPGETVEINTVRGEKYIIGKLDNETEFSNYNKYRDLDITWLELNIGENIFRYDAEQGLDDLDVYIYYNDKYLEVQKCF